MTGTRESRPPRRQGGPPYRRTRLLAAAGLLGIAALTVWPREPTHELASHGELQACVERFNRHTVVPRTVLREAVMEAPQGACRISFWDPRRSTTTAYVWRDDQKAFAPSGGRGVPASEFRALVNVLVDADGRLRLR